MADRVVRLADGRVVDVRAQPAQGCRGGTAVVTGCSRACRVLNRKLLRDLWAMKGQAFAIAAVICAGVTMFVTYLSNFDSLQRTRAGVLPGSSALPTSSPTHAGAFLARATHCRLPGSRSRRHSCRGGRDSRCAGHGRAGHRAVGLAAGSRLASLNAVSLRRGRWLDPSRTDEVLASEMFCEEHGFVPGDSVSVVINGRWRTTDHRRRGALAGVRVQRPTGRDVPGFAPFRHLLDGPPALAAAFNMEGGFNDVSLSLAPDASVEESSPASTGCSSRTAASARYPQSLQVSAWTSRKRADAAADVRLPRPAHLPRRGRVRAACCADPRAGPAARQIAALEGTGLFQRRSRGIT